MLSECGFAPSAFDDPVGGFTKLKQTTTVEEYQTQFEVLSNKIAGLIEDFRISTFLSGLKEEIRITITMLKPNSLPATFGLARLQEEEVTRRNRNYKGNHWSPSPSTYQANRQTYPRLAPPPEPHQLPTPNRPPDTRNTNPTYANNFNTRPTIPMRRISPTQTQERREKGLCYFCEDKYQPGHRCNKPRLYLLEGVELEGKEGVVEEEEAIPEDEVECEVTEGELLSISSHAIAGAPAPKTIQLFGKIAGKSVIILIDTGSTHSFVDLHVAKKAQLPTHEGKRLTVMVANGVTLPCLGCCKAISVHLQGHNFQTTLYLLT